MYMYFTIMIKWETSRAPTVNVSLYVRGGQLFSSAGHIAPLLVSRGPHFSQKGKVKAKNISLRGPYMAREPYVAASCSM